MFARPAPPTLLFGLLLFVGCNGLKPPVLESTLPVRALDIGGHPFAVEVADTPEAMQVGLMFRRELPQEQGMLFVFGAPQRASFWMKNTYLPLSIAYIDREGIILEIHDLQPLETTPVQSESDQIAYALEVNRGWFDQRSLGPGTRVRGLP